MQFRTALPTFLLISLAASTAAYAQRMPEPAGTLIELWGQANGTCRGSSDGAAAEAACVERERLGERLDGLDWCYGRHGQIGADMAWHRCVANSYRSEHSKPECVVADPTSTPLNVRTSPNGRIVGTVANGDRARILDAATDRTGDRWIYIADASNQPLGWVIRKYVVCRR